MFMHPETAKHHLDGQRRALQAAAARHRLASSCGSRHEGPRSPTAKTSCRLRGAASSYAWTSRPNCSGRATPPMPLRCPRQHACQCHAPTRTNRPWPPSDLRSGSVRPRRCGASISRCRSWARAARPERRRQDNGSSHPGDAAEARRRACVRRRRRRCPRSPSGAGADRTDRAVCRDRRAADGCREPRARRTSVPPLGG